MTTREDYKTQEEVCKIFKCSARSLWSWVDKYNENSEIKRHNRKHVAYKLYKDQVNYENIFKGAYNRREKYVKKPSNTTRKLKNYLP